MAAAGLRTGAGFDDRMGALLAARDRQHLIDEAGIQEADPTGGHLESAPAT